MNDIGNLRIGITARIVLALLAWAPVTGIVPASAATGAQAEIPRTMWSELSFLDLPDDGEAFRTLARNEIVPAMQARVDARELFSWALYRVVHADAGYDHVIVRQAIDPGVLADGDAPPTLVAARVARGLYALEDYQTELEVTDRPWLTVTWRDVVGADTSYRRAMDTTWAPVLKTWIADGAPVGFSGYRVALPESGLLGHDRAWVTLYASFEDMLRQHGLKAAFERAASSEAATPPAALEFETALSTLATIAPVTGSDVWQLLEIARRGPPPAQ